MYDHHGNDVAIGSVENMMDITARYVPGKLSKIDATDTITFLLSQVPAFAPDPLGFVKNAISAAEHIGQHQPWFTSGHAADYQMLHDALAAV